MRRILNFTGRKLALAVILVAMGFSTSGCATEGGTVVANEKIVAGYGEPKFTEYFGIELLLPIPESSFLQLLNARKIEFRVIDAGGDRSLIPTPQHRVALNISHVVRVYEIYGGVDAERRVGRRFRAYVDLQGSVVYIENSFSYPAP
jgi:hypothetical protein